MHTLLLFMDMAAMNVAVNSNHSIFITILLKNSINQIKIRVFKRFNRQKIQNLAYKVGGIRAKKFIFIFIILLKAKSLQINFFIQLLWMIMAEFLVEMVKFVFISKNNNQMPEIFWEFKRHLLEMYMLVFYERYKSKKYVEICS